MGQYLAIGIRQIIRFNDVSKNQRYWDSLEDAVRGFEQKFGLTEELYDKIEEDDSILYSLKGDVLLEHLTSLLEPFYKMRYATSDSEKYTSEILSELKNITSAQEMLDYLSNHCGEYLNQIPTYNFIRPPKCWTSITVPCKVLTFSLNGKIIMECYNDLFRYLEQVIRQSLPQSPLLNALIVDIVG